MTDKELLKSIVKQIGDHLYDHCSPATAETRCLSCGHNVCVCVEDDDEEYSVGNRCIYTGKTGCKVCG